MTHTTDFVLKLLDPLDDDALRDMAFTLLGHERAGEAIRHAKDDLDMSEYYYWRSRERATAECGSIDDEEPF